MYHTTNITHIETKPKLETDRSQFTNPNVAFTFQYDSRYYVPRNSNNVISQTTEVNNPLLQRDIVPCSVSDNLRPTYPTLDKQHLIRSDVNKAMENLPVSVQSSINIQVDNSTTVNSQIKPRLQSTKQYETLPFTFYTCSNTQSITKDNTSELINAESEVTPRLQPTKQNETLLLYCTLPQMILQEILCLQITYICRLFQTIEHIQVKPYLHQPM